MSLASFSVVTKTMTWLGVGNVKGVLLCSDGRGDHTRERLLLRGGVVGYNLPTLRPSVLPIARGDTLILATDGLRSALVEDLALGDPPQQMADALLDSHRRGTDDAMVLVACYIGSGQNS
jgi:negative regulator of sigma-B (phosphoserine phosphatase)